VPPPSYPLLKELIAILATCPNFGSWGLKLDGVWLRLTLRKRMIAIRAEEAHSPAQVAELKQLFVSRKERYNKEHSVPESIKPIEDIANRLSSKDTVTDVEITSALEARHNLR
jgi:hypothetical protein